jgi:hypothetical protein
MIIIGYITYEGYIRWLYYVILHIYEYCLLAYYLLDTFVIIYYY